MQFPLSQVDNLNLNLNNDDPLALNNNIPSNSLTTRSHDNKLASKKTPVKRVIKKATAKKPVPSKSESKSNKKNDKKDDKRKKDKK